MRPSRSDAQRLRKGHWGLSFLRRKKPGVATDMCHLGLTWSLWGAGSVAGPSCG